MKLDLRKAWTKTRNATGRCCQWLSDWMVEQQWLRKPFHWLRRIPALVRPLLRPFRRVGGVLRRAAAMLWSTVRHLGRLPAQLKSALLAIARVRPNARFWSVVLGLLVVPFGAFLMVAPANELAASSDVDLRSLLPATWLLAGLATLTAGLGMLFRAPSFRSSLWLALLFSLPLPAESGHRTYQLLVKMQGADEPTQHTLQRLLEGDVRQTLLFLGLSVGLGALLWLRPLRTLQCTTPLLRGRAGFLLAPGYGGAFGVAVGFLLWLGLRQLTEREGLKFLRPVLGAVHVEHLAYGCGALGAVWFARRWWQRRSRAGARTPQRAAPVTAATAPGQVALPQSRPAAAAPTPPTQPTQVRRPQPVGSIPSRP